MKSFNTIFHEKSRERGWTPEVQVGILLDILDNQVRAGKVTTYDLEAHVAEFTKHLDSIPGGLDDPAWTPMGGDGGL